MRKTVAILSVICLLLLFAGCGKAESPEAPEETAAGDSYYVEHEALPEEMVISRAQLPTEEGLYLAGDSPQGKAVHGIYERDGFSLFSLPEEVEHIYAACMKNQEIAVLAGEKPVAVNLWLMDEMKGPENTDEICSLEILGYSMAGELLYRLPLAGQNVSQGAEFFAMEYLGDSFYLMSPYHFLQIGSDGSEVNGFEIYSDLIESSAPGQFVSMCRAGDELYVCTYGDSYDPAYTEMAMCSGACLSRVKGTDFSLEQIYASREIYPLGVGLDEAGKILLFDSEALYNLGQGGGAEISILNWADIKLYSVPFTGIAAVGKGSYILSSNESDILSFLNYGERAETRTELRLRCEQESPSLKVLVERFNYLNDQYYITIEKTKNNAAARAEIIKGDQADIYFFYGNDFLGGVNKENIFEDLAPYMGKSGELSIIPSLQAAIEEKGKVFYLPFDYIIWTMRSLAQIPDTGAMSMEELVEQLEEENPDRNIFQLGWDREGMWKWLCDLSVEAFVDREKGSTNFDSREYVELLESCMALPETPQDFDQYALLTVEQVGNIMRMTGIEGIYGEQYSLSGCPTGGLSSGSCFEIMQSFAMSAESKNKEGVLEFFRFILSPNIIDLRDLTESMCLPASEKQLDYLLEKAGGEGYMMYRSFDSSYMPLQLSRYSVQQLRSLIERTDTVLNAYPDIIEIMVQESEKYFAGERSAEETAAATQSRASIAAAEKYG